MLLGIATDHGGFSLKEELISHLREKGHTVREFGANGLMPDDDYPDFVIPLAQATAAGVVERGIAICGSGIGVCVCANKVPGIRASIAPDTFSARQGVEDDHLNILCLGGRTMGPTVALEIVDAFLNARFSDEDRHLRRLRKVSALESPPAASARHA